MSLMLQEKIYLEPGLNIGKLTFLQKVMPSDPGVIEAGTPLTYILQGSLWQCRCNACERICYISKFQLERKKAISCGCIKRQREQHFSKTHAERNRLKFLKKEISYLVAVFKMESARDVRKAYEIKKKIADLVQERNTLEASIKSRPFSKIPRATGSQEKTPSAKKSR
jgi:NAD-dependent SIR2 family protein deacetylase